MKAFLRSARIAPKKANIVAKMVRGMPVSDAITALKKTHKKAARMIETLVESAVANAEHNDKQTSSTLFIKTIVVNQSLGYRRGIPKARGSVRPITKFLSHIAVTLGVRDAEPAKEVSAAKRTAPSQTRKRVVQKNPSSKPSPKDSAQEPSASSESPSSPA